jgi:hypothetical protein
MSTLAADSAVVTESVQGPAPVTLGPIETPVAVPGIEPLLQLPGTLQLPVPVELAPNQLSEGGPLMALFAPVYLRPAKILAVA